MPHVGKSSKAGTSLELADAVSGALPLSVERSSAASALPLLLAMAALPARAPRSIAVDD
jgi:hypothetical protein